jgi:uncharacterized protein with HEPN domain
MRSRPARAALLDILENLRLAQAFTAALDYETFYEDRRTVYAVTRCFEIISEASRRLPAPLKARHPEIPWRDIAGAGNIYRHNYEDVLEQTLWRTLKVSLEPLLQVVESELARLPEI